VKVARTLADLDEADAVSPVHVAEAAAALPRSGELIGQDGKPRL
jgi:predicted ATPase with chaperone activity